VEVQLLHHHHHHHHPLLHSVHAQADAVEVHLRADRAEEEAFLLRVRAHFPFPFRPWQPR
jgi:hypothetical protein